ncbi:MAG: DnaJ C-terminal domain-containing protein [Alphaproteobacteria bacterium]
MTDSMRDPYEVLGVERRASAADIKAAWRRLAKQCHPDRAPGDDRLAERFHEISAAYEFLRDERKRRRYDAGEIDANGRRRRFGNWEFDEPRGPGHEVWKAGFAGRAGQESPANGRETADLHFKFSSSEREEAFRSQGIFSELFGTRRGAPRMRRRGADVTYRLDVSFEEAACGAIRRVRLPSGRRLDVRIPAGAESGHEIRLDGQGEPGPGGGAPGDARIVIRVEPHALFRREGRNVHSELNVGVAEAVLGAKVTAPTIHGPVSLTVPPGSNTGTVLRLKGKGISPAPEEGRDGGPAGDHFVTLHVMLPDPDDAEFEELVRRWARGHDGHPRGEESSPDGPAPSSAGI